LHDIFSTAVYGEDEYKIRPV